jgi:hypothetical protein
MPGLPPVPGVVRTVLSQTLGDVPGILNRMFWSFTGTMIDAVALSLAEQVASAWNTHLAPNLSNSLSLNSVRATDLSSATAADALADVAYTGGSSAASVPAEVALVTKFITDYKFRGGHPRWYQAGLPEANLATANTWLTSVLNAWGTAFTAFAGEIDGFTDGGVAIFGPVWINYFHGHTNVYESAGNRYREVPTALIIPNTYPVTSFGTNPVLGAQRRRNRAS